MFVDHLVFLLAKPVSVRGTERQHDTKGPTDNISQSDRNEILHKELSHSDLGSAEHGQGNHEHVGHGLYKQEEEQKQKFIVSE